MTRDTTPDELRELLEKATKGDWGVEDPMDHCLTIVANPDDPGYDWGLVAHCDWPGEDDHNLTSAEVKANAALIVAMKRALPALLDAQAEAERLRGENAALRSETTEVWRSVSAALARVDRLEGALRKSVDALEALRSMLEQQPEMQVRRYIGLGIQVNDAIRHGLAALSPTQREGN
jgi:hypothetical protein